MVYSTASFTKFFVVLPAARAALVADGQQLAERVIPRAPTAAAAIDAIQDKVSTSQPVKLDNIAVHQRSFSAITAVRRPLDVSKPLATPPGAQRACASFGEHLTLLCLSRTRRKIHRPVELPVELAGDVALEAAADFPWRYSLGGAPGDVGAGPGAAAHPDQRDGVDGAAEGPVAAAVEPVPDGHAAAGPDRAGAAEGGERGLAMAPARVGEADDGLRGADRPHAEPAGPLIHT